MSTSNPGGKTGSALQRSELLLSFSMLGLLVVFLVPLPTFVLDLLLALNLSTTVLLLLVTLSVKQPLDFSTFPSLLLLFTLFRLSLNVATTRLILLNGDAGDIVLAFGQFVVGGNLVVGLVIFAILIIIQFVVITKGAGRVSEVSARFILDAMPGKQMAIDAEMNAGLIDEAEARKRRAALMAESEFYGTMDGASKFVRGDAIASVIVTAVNLIGGVTVGLLKGQSAAAAVQKYSILTIGDGLITQIPALITATASGLLVTKATSESSLGQELGKQFQGSLAPMRLGSYIVMAIALVPGLPTIPFLALGGGLFFLSRQLSKAAEKAKVAQAKATTVGAGEGDSAQAAPQQSPNEVFARDFIQSDRIALEIGLGLVPLLSSKRGQGLIDRIGSLRREMAKVNGLWMPSVRVRDNTTLDPQTSYQILIGNRVVARNEIRPDYWLAVDPSGNGAGLKSVSGDLYNEPAFNMQAKWILESEVARAEMAGLTTIEASNVLITHLGEMVRKHAHELLSRDDLKALIERVRTESPTIVDELLPNMMTLGAIHRVVTILLEEQVPITNLTRILESLATHYPTTKEPYDLADKVRVDLGRAICDRYRSPDGKMKAIILDMRLDRELKNLTQNHQLILDQTRAEILLLKVKMEYESTKDQFGYYVPLLCERNMRRPLWNLISRELPDLSVISMNELPTDLAFEIVGIVRADEILGMSSNFAPQPPQAPSPTGIPIDPKRPS